MLNALLEKLNIFPQYGNFLVRFIDEDGNHYDTDLSKIGMKNPYVVVHLKKIKIKTCDDCKEPLDYCDCDK